jgi:hypothetical protein
VTVGFRVHAHFATLKFLEMPPSFASAPTSVPVQAVQYKYVASDLTTAAATFSSFNSVSQIVLKQSRIGEQ